MPGVIAESQSVEKARKPTKNEQRRAKKKQQKQEQPNDSDPSALGNAISVESAPANGQKGEDRAVAIQAANNVQDVSTADALSVASPDDPLFAQFADIFAKFQDDGSDQEPSVKEIAKPEVFYDDDDNIQGEDEEEETQKRLSKKARKAASKLSIAELKAIVRKPEVVEWTDTSAEDPKLLVNIKSARNVVPVPSHWSLKREYLSSKRGIEKPGFTLPKFIAETGISDMRDAVLEKQAEATLKQKQRERMQGKMGKLDIDYQKLYEAFFRRQTKPNLTRYGEVYYEGKEFETNLRHLRPGELSDELREALNMPPAAPPPWLINMQKVGPPPSYPALKIPGLNAPPPPGASWGFNHGGYGKPPVDDQNRPLYGGDVFGLVTLEDQATDENEMPSKSEPLDKTLWGELQPFQEEEEEEEEDDEDDEADEDEDNEGTEQTQGGRGGSGIGRQLGMDTPYAGTETPGGFASTIPTPFGGTHAMTEEFNIRKERRGNETETSYHPRSAGTVLGEHQIRAEGFFGGERAYDLSGAAAARQSEMPVLDSGHDDRHRKRKAGDLDVSMDIDALERDDRMTKEQINQQYERQRTQQGAGGWQMGADQEDLSGMVAEESAKRQKREREKRSKK